MSFYSIQNILVPVDLSETSLNAVSGAVAMAKRHQANLHLLHIVEPSFGGNISEAVFASDDKSVDILSALAGAILHTDGIKPSIIQEEGNTSDTIIKTSISRQADVIVMGTHGASGFRSGFIGSNTYNTIKNSRCPVLALPPRKLYAAFRKILFPVRPVAGALSSYDIVCHFLGSQPLLNVLGLSNSPVERETHILDKLIDEIRDKLIEGKVKANALWTSGHNIAEDVLRFAQPNLVDLIVITSALDATNKPNFIGPYTQRIINSSKVPILSIKKVGVPALT